MSKTRMILALVVSLALTVAILAATSPSGASETKTICHQGTTTEVPHSLVWQHIDEQGNPQPGHEGDHYGVCTTTTTTVPDQTTTTTTPTPPPTIPPPVILCNVDGRAVEVPAGAPCPVPDEPKLTG